MSETPSQTPPRLASTSETDYAPISWTAVASLAVAILFGLILAVMLVSLRRGQPLIEQWLFVFPVLAIVLAFVARRQIRASEGTRAGEQYANLGWWIAMIGGIGYIAYLGAVDYGIRGDAQKKFQEWANNLTDLDANNPNDPKFFAALYQTLPPSVRSGLSPKDTTAMERAFAIETVGFRQMDVVRMCSRNRGQVQIKPNGLRDWQQKPTEITATLTATMTTPEGEFGLVVPMRAVVDENKARLWQISPSQEGFIKSAALTRYGWEVALIEADGRAFANEFLARFATGDQGVLAYFGYVQPGTTPQTAAKVLDFTVRQADPRAAVTGNLTRPEVYQPLPADWKTILTDRVFALPGGAKAPPALAQQLLAFWQSVNRFLPSGVVNKSTPDLHPILVLPTGSGPGVIELRQPIEVAIGDGAQSPTAARGRVVLQVPAELSGAKLAELAAGRAAGPGAPKTVQPPEGMTGLPKLPWRVVRLETDLKPVAAPAQAGPGG